MFQIFTVKHRLRKFGIWLETYLENLNLQAINTVYHRLQYLLPGESVKMADTTRSGVSQTFFQRHLMCVFLRNEKNLYLNVFICCPCA